MPHRLSARISLYTATIVAITTLVIVTTASAQVTAKGAAVPMPTAASPLLLFGQDPSVTVQLVNDAAPACWTSEFIPAGTKVNKAAPFKSKRP